MIEKLTEKEMIRPYEVGAKINELIDAFNNHQHTVSDSNDLSSFHITSVPTEEQ